MIDRKFKFEILDTRSFDNEEYEKDFLKRTHKDYDISELPEVKDFSAFSYCIA